MTNIEFYKSVKNSGDADAMLKLILGASKEQSDAILYLGLLKILVKNGDVIDPLCVIALSYINLGYPIAMYKVAEALGSVDNGLTVDNENASKWLEHAKELGLMHAVVSLVKKFAMETEEQPQLGKAMYWGLVSCSLGNFELVSLCSSIFFYIQIHDPDHNENPDPWTLERLIDWSKIIFDRDGDSRAAINIALLYQIRALKGFKLEIDDNIWWLQESKQYIRKAREWLEVVYEKGMSFAAYNLGYIHLYGALDRKSGIAQDVDKAIEWFEKAYNLKGKFSGHAAEMLYRVYSSNDHKRLNLDLATQWRNNYSQWALNKFNEVPSIIIDIPFSIILWHLYCTPFVTPGSWCRHFLKHGHEFGCSDKYEYQNKAISVIKSGTCILRQYKDRLGKAYIQDIEGSVPEQVAFVALDESHSIRTCHVKEKASLDLSNVVPNTGEDLIGSLHRLSYGRPEYEHGVKTLKFQVS